MKTDTIEVNVELEFDEGIPYLHWKKGFSNILAAFMGVPYKEPIFTFSFEGGHHYLAYDAGMDYASDGYTYQKEWHLSPELPRNIINRGTGYWCNKCETLCHTYEQGLCCDCDQPWKTEQMDELQYPPEWSKVEVVVQK